ncbi:peptidase family M48-domain containing protein [Nitzschia inconspicua]|uniref:CAAX prenyl protease n=1 Tax=Nitzschia inconspicua TaxID=303405 RepID=A0A9K3KWU8_9STRA|nr:peptidase family M48-domain containing protein [Nitzschia inconspicua]
MPNLELPWKPIYTQSGGFNWDGGIGSKSSENDPSLWSWSLSLTVAFTLVVYVLEKFLDGRQKRAYQQTQFPKQLETTVAKIDAQGYKQKKEDSDAADAATPAEKPLLQQLQDKFKSSQSYGLDKINFGMIASTYDTLESVVFLLLGFLPYMWDVSVHLGQVYLGYTQEDEIKITLIFLLLITLVGTVTSLPFELYSTFGIERKHGFNKQTYGLFFSDKVKSLALTFLIGGPFVALLLKIIQMGGEYFYLYVWAFMFVFSVFMMTIVPVFIMPLFNKYEPLPDGTLKTRIYELADKLSYPLKKLFVVDGSKRSSHSNAYMYGFGSNKRIVLFDTLMEQVSDDEILAILGHELGHWKLGHTLTNFCVTQVYFGAAFYFFSQCYTAKELYAAFGFDSQSGSIPTVIALMLFFQTLWAPVDKVLSFVLTIFSRHCEFAADEFSVKLGMSQMLQSGLCKIHLENLGAMCPDPWYSMYHYSHPPLVERLGAMMELDKKKA